ncbi:MAG: sugar phosphate isomerase/epimerase [Ruminococcaceae bacterium]|nr:sugar phosphate isomerase/epimerase [Oscillospiraceae bacterium]
MLNTRIAFYTRPYPRIRSWFEMIDEAAKRGMTAIEGFTNMELAEPDPEAARKIRAYADEKGVRFCCLSCFCNFALDDTEDQITRMMRYIDVASILGSPYFHHTLVAGYPTPDYVLQNWDALFENAVHAVRRLYDYGQTKNVRLIYEDQGYMFNGLVNYGKFLDAVDRNVGVLLDFGNHYNVDEELDGFLEAYLPRVCHVHIKDVLYAPTPDGMPDSLYTLKGNYFWPVAMGTGIMDHKKYITRLENAGYSGLYSLEYSAPSDDSSLIDDTIATLSSWLAR